MNYPHIFLNEIEPSEILSCLELYHIRPGTSNKSDVSIVYIGRYLEKMWLPWKTGSLMWLKGPSPNWLGYLGKIVSAQTDWVIWLNCDQPKLTGLSGRKKLD